MPERAKRAHRNWTAISLVTLAGAACHTGPSSENEPSPIESARSASGGGPTLEEITRPEDTLAHATFAGDATLLVWFAGVERLLEDPRDAGLLRAVSMLDERLAELPGELGGGPPPPGAIELLCDALRSPFCFQIEVLDDEPATPFPLPFRAQWTVRCASAADADRMVSRLEALLALGMPPASPVDGHPELHLLPTPAGNFFYGRSGENDFVLSFGPPWARWPEKSAFGLASDTEPVLGFAFDLTTFLRTAVSLAGEEGAELRKLFESLGMLGEEPYGFEFVAGHGPDRARQVLRTRNWVHLARQSGTLAEQSLTHEELGLVPADATAVTLGKADFRMVLRMLELSPQAHVVNDWVRAELGLDLATDLIDTLGTTFGGYFSESTGGGGLASGVLILGLADEAHFGHTLDVLCQKLEAVVSEKAPGRVRVHPWNHGSTTCRSIVFPGLPIPLEPSFALLHGRLFAAATPTALSSALEQAESGGEGLLAHPAFRAHELGSLNHLQSVAFHDGPHFLEDGYAYASFLGSALANAVRSASDGEREPGVVIPPYHALRDGARPTIVLGRVEGDDLVAVGEGDRSVVASLTALAGWAPEFVTGVVLVGSLVALAGPDHEHEMDAASWQRAKAQADIVSLESAVLDYAIENTGRYPDSLDVLGVPDENGSAFLDVPGPYIDPWGNPYRYEPPTGTEGKPHVFSYGADGVPGGEGLDADIDNRQGDVESDEDEG